MLSPEICLNTHPQTEFIFQPFSLLPGVDWSMNLSPDKPLILVMEQSFMAKIYFTWATQTRYLNIY